MIKESVWTIGDVNPKCPFKKQDILDLEYFAIPDDEKWRISLINEILEAQNLSYEIQDFSFDDLHDMLAYACTS